MNKHRYQGDIERLRYSERLARLEVGRVIALTLDSETIQSVLDIGTGTGVFAEAFMKHGLKVIGLDANPKMLEVARQHIPSISFHEGVAETLPYKDNAFDLVFMGLVLHETDDSLQALQDAARVARTRIAILEWAYREEEFGPPLDERINGEEMDKLAHQVGLLVARNLPLEHLMLYLIEKPYACNG